jgi:hypothetical protein
MKAYVVDVEQDELLLLRRDVGLFVDNRTQAAQFVCEKLQVCTGGHDSSSKT